jgi:hypothetical protein
MTQNIRKYESEDDDDDKTTTTYYGWVWVFAGRGAFKTLTENLEN